MLFFGFGSTLIDAHTLPGQTEGLKGWLRNGWRAKVWADGWAGGFAKVDNRFGYEIWI